MPIPPCPWAFTLLAAAVAPLLPIACPAVPLPVSVEGAVIESGGAPLPSPALVTAVCDGTKQRETYTDGKGRFWIELSDGGTGATAGTPFGYDISDGPPLDVMRANASPTPIGGRQAVRTCEVEAVIPGYRSNPVRLGPDLVRPNIGTIVMRRVGAAEGRFVSVTTMAAPKKARQAYGKGLDALREGKREAALKHFTEAVRAYPEHAAAWGEVAALESAAGRREEARRAIEHALRADSRYLPPYLTLAQIEVAEMRWEAADETTGTLIRLDPFDYPQAYLMKAMARYNLGDREAAWKCLLEAQKLDLKRAYPQIWNLSGILQAEQGNFAGAVADLREYLRLSPSGANAEAARQRLSQYERLLSGTQPDTTR